MGGEAEKERVGIMISRELMQRIRKHLGAKQAKTGERTTQSEFFEEALQDHLESEWEDI